MKKENFFYQKFVNFAWKVTRLQNKCEIDEKKNILTPVSKTLRIYWIMSDRFFCIRLSTNSQTAQI